MKEKEESTLLSYLMSVSRKMVEAESLEPILLDTMREAVKLVGAERGYVVLMEGEDYKEKGERKGGSSEGRGGRRIMRRKEKENQEEEW